MFSASTGQRRAPSRNARLLQRLERLEINRYNLTDGSRTQVRTFPSHFGSTLIHLVAFGEGHSSQICQWVNLLTFNLWEKPTTNPFKNWYLVNDLIGFYGIRANFANLFEKILSLTHKTNSKISLLTTLAWAHQLICVLLTGVKKVVNVFEVLRHFMSFLIWDQ